MRLAHPVQYASCCSGRSGAAALVSKRLGAVAQSLRARGLARREHHARWRIRGHDTEFACYLHDYVSGEAVSVVRANCGAIPETLFANRNCSATGRRIHWSLARHFKRKPGSMLQAAVSNAPLARLRHTGRSGSTVSRERKRRRAPRAREPLSRAPRPAHRPAETASSLRVERR